MKYIVCICQLYIILENKIDVKTGYNLKTFIALALSCDKPNNRSQSATVFFELS